MADLAKVKITDTFKVYLELNGEPLVNDAVGGETPTTMSITFNGPNSKAYREYMLDQQDEMLVDLRKNGDKANDIDARGITAKRTKRLVDNATDWDITLGGKPKFSKKAIEKFFDDYPMFFFQVEDGFEKEVGFTVD